MKYEENKKAAHKANYSTQNPATEPVAVADVADRPSGMTLHIQRTITEHIPLKTGESGMTIGQFIDIQMQEYANNKETVSFLELEISAEAWHQYITGAFNI